MDHSRNLIGMSLAHRFRGEQEGFWLDAISTIGLSHHDCGGN